MHQRDTKDKKCSRIEDIVQIKEAENKVRSREEAIEFCLTMPGVYEDYPFKDHGWTTMRCCSNKKVFAWIFERQGNIWINVKVDPEWRDFWRSTFPAVLPAYHLNKEHWNSIVLDGSIPEEEIHRMIEESYELVKRKNK